MYNPTTTPYMPQNVDATTRMLIGKKLKGELGAYVAQHKDDPNLVALAMFVNNLDETSKAMKNAGPQPTVVDQQIAKMSPQPVQQPVQQASQQLPEDTGIAQLPADNIKDMAGGGIVAFEEGGEVPRMFAGGVPPRPVQRMVGDPAAANWDRMYGAEYAPDGTPKASKQQYILDPATKSYVLNPEYVAPKPTVPAATTPAPQGTSPLINKEQGVVDSAIEQKRAEDAAAAAGTKLPPEPGLPSINSYMKQFEMALPKKEETQSEETFMNKRAEPMKEYFDKAGASIEKEAARLKTDKEQDFYMSLIQGGLAAAAESGPNALQNIAKGFSVGASSYKDALKDFRKAAQENSKMEMDLMRAKAADKKGDMDAFQKHSEAVAERNTKIDGYKVSGVASLLGHQMSSSATLGAAKYNRDAMGDYRNSSQVETIRKNIDAKLGDDPKFKFNAGARAAEVERRLQIELQRYPNLVGYAGSPTGGGAPSALKYNEKTGKIEQEN